MFTQYLTPALTNDIRQSLQKEPKLMLRDLALRLGLPEGAIARALPADICRFAPPGAFDEIWQAMTTWSRITFIAITPGLVLEYKGVLPGGSHGHGMFNLHAEHHPLGGHFFIRNLAAICFLSRPFFGLESHSVQFYDESGAGMCAVYVGRAGREPIPEVRAAFMALRERCCIAEEAA